MNRDEDRNLWRQHQIVLIESGSFSDVDWRGIQEELGEMSSRERRWLRHNYRRILRYSLKWGFQREKRSNVWVSAIQRSRDEIIEVLKESPSLRGYLEMLISERKIFEIIKQMVAAEIGMLERNITEKESLSLRDILEKKFKWL